MNSQPQPAARRDNAAPAQPHGHASNISAHIDHADRRLIELRHEFDRRVVTCLQLLECADAREALLDDRVPPPDALKFRPEDAPMLRRIRLAEPTGDGHYDHKTVENLRGVGGVIAIAGGFAPSPECARAKEIAAAFDRRAEEREKLRTTLGMPTPDAAFEDACAPVEALRDEMAALRASTIDGLAAKAHAACRCLEGHYDIDDPTDEGLVASILRDLLNLPRGLAAPANLTA